MFTPLNKETSKKKMQSIVRERRSIKSVYYRYLLDLNKLDEIFSLQLEHEENCKVLNQIKESALYNFLTKYKDLDIEKYDIFKYRRVLLLYIRNLTEKKEFIKGKKLLNICRDKKYICNEYYELLEIINRNIII
ncbi:uncharacterized protein VNE69_04091 [Vairimorpha necatrix]|uniref:Uncharacterized protein n=1 Tax=Vairimorpha necatrix TaxID=6039 RepID=A0AAX4JBE4_9MICR